ncbi:MAG: phosphate signaling complex protein PhoU [Lachnospiraceae bacterium]|nr:phosphate signaling complex protein PhoU [Lachnospiraceae bacterium]
MRNRFDEQLELLNTEMIRMGALCERAIEGAVKALVTGDRKLAEQIQSQDDEVNHQERTIESLCLKLLLQQQPVARDLRQISSALKMITDMERIGDQAADIAAILTAEKKYDLPAGVPVEEMAKATSKMVTDSVDAYVRKDLQAAQAIIAYDDVVDRLFSQVKKELIRLLSQSEESGEWVIDLLMIAKYFERIGDHATNIAEWVEFSITGVHPEM